MARSTPRQLRTALHLPEPYLSRQGGGRARLEDGSGAKLACVALPGRTLARRKREQRLTAEESDRLFRLARIAAMAREILGDPEKARRWLRKPNRALGGEVSLGLMDTGAGARQVEAVLGRIEHGVAS